MTGGARPQFLLLLEAWYSLEFSRRACVHAQAGGQERLQPGPWKARRAGFWLWVKGKQFAYCCLIKVTFGNKKQETHQQWLELQRI